MTITQSLTEILDSVDPAALTYEEWCSVGMALKEEGYTAADWDSWSRRDTARYHPGECFQKWDSFHGSSNPVKGGTIVQLARDQGWSPPSDGEGYELAWDSVIGGHDDEWVIIDRNWIEGREVTEPDHWDPVAQLVTYLETLFEAAENVGYVTESWQSEDGKWKPKSKGAYDRTAGELIQKLNACDGDIGAVLGDYKEEAGAWIRFNPLDGQGVKNGNVTDYRYALVESDSMDIDQQNAIIRELELPVACLVHSGKKSLHAIVRIDAGSYDEYRKRVDYLYSVCKKNGLTVDQQNRNPSRLSRMPGIMRGGRKQFLVDTNIGKESWVEWQEWIESVNDDLPDPESLTDVWDDLPELSPPLIHGVLRQGHKMLLAGPSKAGKSYALIEMCCAIAEGREWLGWPCAMGRVLYVNLELDRASCLHRFKDVYAALGWDAANRGNIDIWNLRGNSVPMDKLAPKLIRRAAKKNYIAIVIDPIYKVITGDENSADQMAHFCNQFDRVCSELGAAVIYCHHHSKGTQGNKRSMDRASGSGVFARDPDALLDLIELDLTDAIRKQEENKAICAAVDEYMNREHSGWDDEVSQDDLCSVTALQDICRKLLTPDAYDRLQQAVEAARTVCGRRTAWRIDGTLREFPKFPPVNIWFDYPIHRADNSGTLADAHPEAEAPPWERATKSRKKSAKAKAADLNAELDNAITDYRNMNFGDYPTTADLAECMGIAVRTVRDRIKKHGDYIIDKETGRLVPESEIVDDETKGGDDQE